MREVLIDFETGSTCDLKKAGAWRYSEDPTTEIICLGYWVSGGEPKVLTEADLRAHNELKALASDPEVRVIAHNVGFEKAIWRHILVAHYGYPDIPDERWHDIMAACAERGLPMELKRAGAALHMAQQKDAGGKALLTRISSIIKVGGKPPEELLRRVYEYNLQDLRSEGPIHRRLGLLQPVNRTNWLLDQRINQRGVRIDLPYVKACLKIVDDTTLVMAKEFSGLTDGLTVNQRDKVLKWANDQVGGRIANLQKGTIDALLGVDDEEEDAEEYDGPPLPELPDNVKRALTIRRVLGSASVKKLDRFLRCSGSDGRVHGALQWHAAGTGRWGGRLFQPQNFPRDSHKGLAPADVIMLLKSGDADLVQAVLGDPIDAVLKGLRHSIIAADGCELNVGDFMTIEARIVLALAGQWDKVDMLAAGKSPYIPMAEAIFKRPIGKHTDVFEYTIGKNTVLGCGFQMGAKTFRARYCSHLPMEFAEDVIQKYRREFAPEVPKLWAALEKAALDAVAEHKTTEAHGIVFSWEDIFLTARLPSGRKLYYAYPELTRKEMPWSTPERPDVRLAWTSKAFKKGRWITRDMYGGLITENVVQAIARDLLCEAALRCEDNNVPLVLTVHDELVGEPLLRYSSHEAMRQLMRERSTWATELRIPVDAECWADAAYRK